MGVCAMDPLKVSAQFAAFRWYYNRVAPCTDRGEEAAQFARENWVAFLPEASEKMGRILLRLAALREMGAPSRN
jgi:hypothetical protein